MTGAEGSGRVVQRSEHSELRPPEQPCAAAAPVALAVTGTVSARLRTSLPARAVLRVVVGGAGGSPGPTASVTSSARSSADPAAGSSKPTTNGAT